MVDVSASKLKDCMRQFILSRKLQATLDPSLIHWTPASPASAANTRRPPVTHSTSLRPAFILFRLTHGVPRSGRPVDHSDLVDFYISKEKVVKYDMIFDIYSSVKSEHGQLNLRHCIKCSLG